VVETIKKENKHFKYLYGILCHIDLTTTRLYNYEDQQYTLYVLHREYQTRHKNCRPPFMSYHWS